MKKPRIFMLLGAAAMTAVAGVLLLRHEKPAGPGTREIPVGAPICALPQRPRIPLTAGRVRAGYDKFPASLLVEVICNVELFNSLEPEVKAGIFRKLADIHPRSAVELVLDGSVSTELWKDVQLNPSLFRDDRDFAAGLLVSLYAGGSERSARLHEALLACGTLRDLPVVVAALMQRQRENGDAAAEVRIYLRLLADQKPEEGLKLALKTDAPAAERLDSLFIVGEELARDQSHAENPVYHDLTHEERMVLDAGRAASLLREENPEGLALARDLPEEDQVRLVARTATMKGIARLEPPFAMQLISKADESGELRESIQAAAYTVAIKSPDLVADWVRQQPPSTKRTAVAEGLVKRLEETAAPEAADWREFLNTNPAAKPGSR